MPEEATSLKDLIYGRMRSFKIAIVNLFSEYSYLGDYEGFGENEKKHLIM